MRVTEFGLFQYPGYIINALFFVQKKGWFVDMDHEIACNADKLLIINII